MGMFAEPFPNNGCLSWLHSSCLEQITHNIFIQVELEENASTQDEACQCELNADFSYTNCWSTWLCAHL
jgi:hypothetical protein